LDLDKVNRKKYFVLQNLILFFVLA
jgi:hypothetical protein